MQLINTLEIGPYDYTDKAYHSPAGSPAEFPEEWNRFWLGCISDSGLGNLTAVRKGSYLVAMESIGDRELEIILKQRLKDLDLTEFEDQVGCLYGGIVLKAHEQFLIEPMCCSDIGTINEWEGMLEGELIPWRQLWIGHPWVYYNLEDGIVQFTEYTESGLENLNEIAIAFRVPELELKTELYKAINQQEIFRDRIRQALDRMGIANSERMAALMTGNTSAG